MKTNHSGKVITAIFSFFLAAICLVGSTYAWFSIANQARIDDFEMTLASTGEISLGLKVNSEALAKKYHLNVGDIYYPEGGDIHENLLEEFHQVSRLNQLVSVSSGYEEEWLNDSSIAPDEKKPLFYKLPNRLDFHGDEIVGEAEKVSYYYQMELYVKATMPMFIYVDNKTSLVANTEKNHQVALANDKVTEEDLNSVEKSLRMSFYSNTNYFKYEPFPEYDDQNQKISNPMFGKLDIAPLDGIYDFDPHTKHEYLFGNYKNVDKIVYDETGRSTGAVFDEDKTNLMIANSDENAICVDVNKSIENGIEGKLEDTYTLEEISNKKKDVDEKFALCQLPGTDIPDATIPYEQRIVVSVWAEGWDPDAIIYSSSSHFLLNLVFGGKTLRE